MEYSLTNYLHNWGLPLEWLRTYLFDRQQFVRVRLSVSSMKTINNDVPQGSVLGPILFPICINEFPNSSDILLPSLFAEDTTLSKMIIHCISNDNYE